MQTDQLFLKASGVEEILTITVQRLQQRSIAWWWFTPSRATSWTNRAITAQPTARTTIAPAAEWTFKNLEPSGAHAALFPPGFLYSLIRTEDRRYGVIGGGGDRPMSEMEANLVQALLNECALTLERDFC